jgi:hypothetical protein
MRCFEINIDSSIEKIDTSFYPKYRDLSNYSNICCTYTQFSNDTVIVDSIKKVLFNPERNGRGLSGRKTMGVSHLLKSATINIRQIQSLFISSMNSITKNSLINLIYNFMNLLSLPFIEYDVISFLTCGYNSCICTGGITSETQLIQTHE